MRLILDGERVAALAMMTELYTAQFCICQILEKIRSTKGKWELKEMIEREYAKKTLRKWN
jgi:hypothetical protein